MFAMRKTPFASTVWMACLNAVVVGRSFRGGLASLSTSLDKAALCTRRLNPFRQREVRESHHECQEAPTQAVLHWCLVSAFYRHSEGMAQLHSGTTTAYGKRLAAIAAYATKG